MKGLLWNIIRIHFLFAALNQTFKQLLSNIQHGKPSNYKQLWRLRLGRSCVYKKCTLIITCFSHTVKQAICHLELTSISKTVIAFSKSAKNFRRDNNIYFLSNKIPITSLHLHNLWLTSKNISINTLHLHNLWYESNNFSITTLHLHNL